MPINDALPVPLLQACSAVDLPEVLLRAKVKWGRAICACLVVLLCSLASGTAWAKFNDVDDKQSLEVAHVVMGISSYVRWPYAFSDLQICIAGDAKYADVLRNGALSEARYRVRSQLPPFTSPVSFSDCQIVYVGIVDDQARNDLFAQMGGWPILSISEPLIPCASGSMFCLKFHHAQLVFDINLDAVARSGLRVHPNVLHLAKRKAVLP